ncbi:MAG: hypothetical protein V4808_02770 [Pseudomonadota bacterium]
MLSALALLIAPALALPSGDKATYRGATITGYNAEPVAASGIMTVLRAVYITTVEGDRRKIYFIHGGKDLFLTDGGKPYPAIGSECDFVTKAHHISSDENGDGGRDGPLGELITSVRC